MHAACKGVGKAEMEAIMLQWKVFDIIEASNLLG